MTFEVDAMRVATFEHMLGLWFIGHRVVWQLIRLGFQGNANTEPLSVM